jgi:hypothetical protein
MRIRKDMLFGMVGGILVVAGFIWTGALIVELQAVKTELLLLKPPASRKGARSE